ncbi:MAG: GT2 family glycosyltransferase [Paraglaciecola sp.]|jgi:GT2 family glycosyltransferase
MEVSFIIPHKGRHLMLVQTVTSIAQQNYPLTDVEVIIISESEALKEEVFINPIFEQLTIVIKHYNGDTISAMRNMGLMLATGKYIGFIDADVQLSANWLKTMKDTLNQQDVVMSSAWQICGKDATQLENVRVALSNIQVDCDLMFLPGRNLFLLREHVERVGGFPEHLITCEDYYFTHKVAEYGRLRYLSSANYVHLGEDKDYRTLWEKEIWRGQSNLQSLSGRDFNWSELPSLLTPLGIATFVIAFLISTIFGWYQLLPFILACVFLPVLAYSSRLKFGAGNALSFISIFKFYSVYLAARSVGTISGVFKKIGAGRGESVT